MRRLIVLWLLAIVALAPARAESPADRWNLADLYPSVAAWDADAAKLEAQLPDLAACQGHLGDSATRLRQCMDLQADMLKRLYRMYAFAGQQLAEDTGAAASQALVQKAELLENRINETGSFFDPELLRIGQARGAADKAADLEGCESPYRQLPGFGR